MRNQQKRKDRPSSLHKRGGASGGGGAGGGVTERKNVKDAPDTMDSRGTLASRVDMFDKVFNDLDTVAPTMGVQDANRLIREALNIGSNAPIPDEVSSAQAAAIMRKIAYASKFNLKNSKLNYYLDY